jgi:hypothetical protein
MSIGFILFLLFIGFIIYIYYYLKKKYGDISSAVSSLNPINSIGNNIKSIF